MELFASRVRPRGLYLLDEPEAPLSPMKQLALLALVVRAAEDGAQFIIATHSPILLACPVLESSASTHRRFTRSRTTTSSTST
ncbi:MAG: hypothetical protein QOI41_4075 [Myxococcales bacterium]|nr:hypothetical protein [Myxococcales bacterium]